MRSRFAVLLSLFLAAVAPAAFAEGTAALAPPGAPREGTFYYHWETPEKLLLWQDLGQLVGVTVELRNGEWLPADRQGLLRRLDVEIETRYAAQDRAAVRQSWDTWLSAALSRSGGDYKRWLEPLRLPNGPTLGFVPRQPDVMICLQIDTAEKKARMRLLSGLGAVGSQAYEIVQQKKGQKTVWTTSGIPIETAMGVRWRSAPILEFVGLKEPWPADFWTELVDTWKGSPVGSHRQHLYKTRQGEIAWGWFEVIDAQGWLRLSGTKGPIHIMPTQIPAPAAPVLGSQAPLPQAEPPTWTRGDNGVVWLLIGQLWLVASGAFLVVRSYLLFRPVPHTERLRQRSLDLEKDEFEYQRLRGIDSLLNSTYRKWCQRASEEDSPPKQQAPTDWLQSIPELLIQADSSNAALNTEVGGLRENLRQAGERISRLEDTERILNESVENLKAKVVKLEPLEGNLKEQGRLLTAAKNEISDLKTENAKLIDERTSLQGKLEKAGRDRTQAEAALRQEHAQAEAALREEIETWKVAEANTRQELGVSDQTAQRLREDLSAARSEIGTFKETLQNLGEAAQRLEAVGAINAVSLFLRRGQNEFLDESDVQSAGLLAFLVTHSLNQLALSRAFRQEKKASAMLWNLHNIASRLAARYSGFKQALPRLQELGASNAPLADNLIAVNAQHEDSKIFQLILKQLRTAHRIDLAPFYFDVTKDGQVVRAN